MVKMGHVPEMVPKVLLPMGRWVHPVCLLKGEDQMELLK